MDKNKFDQFINDNDGIEIRYYYYTLTSNQIREIKNVRDQFRKLDLKMKEDLEDSDE